MEQQFTIEDIESCWEDQHRIKYLLDILNGEYELDTAREDLKGLIGSKYDSRIAIKTPFDDMDNLIKETEPVQNVYYFTVQSINDGIEVGHETIAISEDEAEIKVRDYFREHYATEINITGCYNTTSQHAQM